MRYFGGKICGKSTVIFVMQSVTKNGAALHCCRTAPGVNNRSLASELRAAGGSLDTGDVRHGGHDAAAAVHDPVVEPYEEIGARDLGLGAQDGLALCGVGRNQSE